MKVEQLKWKLSSRQYFSLDSAHRADEKRLDPGLEPVHRARDGEARIQMSAGPATGEKNPHLGPAQCE